MSIFYNIYSMHHTNTHTFASTSFLPKKCTYHFSSHKHFVLCYLHCTQLPVERVGTAWCWLPDLPHLPPCFTLSLLSSVLLSPSLALCLLLFSPKLLIPSKKKKNAAIVHSGGGLQLKHHQCFFTEPQSEVQDSGWSASARLPGRQVLL